MALPATGLYPVAVLALIVAGYGAADLAKASGFLAVYAAAVLLGNVRLPHGPATRGFAEGVGWLAQIGLFVMLGLLASPPRLPAQILPALAVGVILALIARPVAVLAATLPFRLPLRQQAFLSWAGLRGAVPIVLATIPLSAHVAGATRLFDQVFVIVVAFTLLQGPTLPWVARRLDVTAPAEPLEIIVDAAPLDDLHADLLQAQVPDGSKLHGVEIFELRLPVRGQHRADRPRRPRPGPRAGHRAAHRGPPADRRAGRRPGPDRAPPPRGQPRGQAGPLARRARPLSQKARARARPSRRVSPRRRPAPA